MPSELGVLSFPILPPSHSTYKSRSHVERMTAHNIGGGFSTTFILRGGRTGRLHQVEYAIEAINNAGTCVGILCSDGIVLAAERKTTSKLLAPSKSSDKIYQIDGHIASVVAGLTSDANILINQGASPETSKKEQRTSKLRCIGRDHTRPCRKEADHLLSAACAFVYVYAPSGRSALEFNPPLCPFPLASVRT